MIGIDRRLLKNFDWILLLVAIFITFIGIVTVYSANYEAQGNSALSMLYAKKQVVWFMIAITVMIIFMLFDYSLLEEYATYIYTINIILLIAVLIIGKKSLGAQRWLSFGGFTFQPSELFKFTAIILVAKFFSKENSLKKYKLLDILKLILIIVIPVVLIVKQPDLGTGLLILSVFASMIIFVGINFSSVFKIAVAGLVVLPVGWNFLKGYQKNRILTFLFPERDPLGAGYHIIQSKIAVGSGRLLGKGYLNGTQNKLHFLPEEHTDFIFSVFAEEWGFIGAVVLIAVYFLFFILILKVSKKAKDNFGALIVIGALFIFLWQFFINIGMVIGLLPVVGIPLPLMSYGGTSLVVSYALIGLILNVSMRRFIF
jgi:rod shape determining protein RodA